MRKLSLPGRRTKGSELRTWSYTGCLNRNGPKEKLSLPGRSRTYGGPSGLSISLKRVS